MNKENSNRTRPCAFVSACSELVSSTGELLTSVGAHAAVAESLTGGLVCSEIVRVAGSSKWFTEGCVTYAEQAKARRLGVDPHDIERFTAVSRQVAEQMATGMLNTSGADIAVSTTGLAGPGCDDLGREAGLVFIGGACKNGSVTKKLSLSGSRTEIRQQAALEALKLLHELALVITRT